MKCEKCKEKIKGNSWMWDAKDLCEECFVEIAAENYNNGYDTMIEEEKKL